MKKSIAALVIGSALLLPNSNSVEASSLVKDAQVKKIQCVEYNGWGTKQFNSKNSQPGKHVYKGKHHKWNKPSSKQPEVDTPAPTPPVSKPESKPTPPVTKPESKPTPPVTKPESKPTPPVAKPNPAPTPVPPVENPAPSVPVEKPVEGTPDTSISAIEQEVLNLTNAERQKAGLQPLQADSKLMNSARQKSTDMAKNNYFSHTSPTYGSPFDQMKANGVSYRSAAENIAMGQRSAEEVVKGWMNSPGHRQNILTPDFTHIGIGYDANGNYWTQQFISK